MDLNRIETFYISKNREKELWKNAVFVFDTSALLEFYYYSEETRNEIISEIFEKLRKRLWIPNHVEFEFLKNREKVLEKPIKKYQALLQPEGNNRNSSGFIDGIGKSLENIGGLIQTLIEQTKEKDRHPYFKIDYFKEFNDQFEAFRKAYESLSHNIREEIKVKSAALSKNKVILNDKIAKCFEGYIEVGKGFKFHELFDIAKEGKERYALKIPPGYEDYHEGKNEKIGLQMFADLVIWKEIISYSKENNVDVILITNDVKNDWWQFENKKRTKVPRHELITEILDSTGNNFWMYDISDFIFLSTKFLGADLDEEEIDEIIKVRENVRQYENVNDNSSTIKRLKLLHNDVQKGLNELTESLGKRGKKITSHIIHQREFTADELKFVDAKNYWNDQQFLRELKWLDNLIVNLIDRLEKNTPATEDLELVYELLDKYTSR